MSSINTEVEPNSNCTLTKIESIIKFGLIQIATKCHLVIFKFNDRSVSASKVQPLEKLIEEHGTVDKAIQQLAIIVDSDEELKELILNLTNLNEENRIDESNNDDIADEIFETENLIHSRFIKLTGLDGINYLDEDTFDNFRDKLFEYIY